MKRILVGVVLVRLAVPHCPSTSAQETAEPTSTVEEELRKLREAGIPTTLEELDLPDIPDEENGALVYREAFELLDSLREKHEEEWEHIPYVGKLTWDETPADKKKAVAELVLSNPDFVKLYELLQKASGMRCSFFAEDDYRKQPGTLWGERLQHLTRLRVCVRMLAARAQLAAEDGEIDAALRTILANLRTARSLSEEPSVAFQLARMIALDGIALDSLQVVLNRGTGNLHFCGSLISEIRDERKAHLAQSALRREIVIGGLRLLSYLREGGSKESEDYIEVAGAWLAGLPEEDRSVSLRILREEGPYKFWYQEKLIYLAGMYELFSAFGKPYWERERALLGFRQIVREQPRGRGIFIRAMERVYSGNYDAEARLDAQLGNAELALALRMYKAKHGFYPFRLADLVPEILPELPKDPYTGKDFVYNPKGLRIFIYSVGPNLKDDLGVTQGQVRGGYDYDIVWELRYF